MNISGFEKFSMVDYGDKIACTVFCEGCNFRCPFCHNASLVLNGNHQAYIQESEVLDYLKQRKGLVDGVCVSGGEPTLNKHLGSFIQKVKDIGYCVKLDTNGSNPTMLKQLVDSKLIDYVAMDIKNNLEDYAAITNIKNPDIQAIKQSIDYLINGDIDYEFRTTLVEGFHMKSNIQKIAQLIKGAKRYYLQKFVDSGDCIQGQLAAVSKQQAQEYQEILNKTVQLVSLRGY